MALLAFVMLPALLLENQQFSATPMFDHRR
jgi:hypothetical protein